MSDESEVVFLRQGLERLASMQAFGMPGVTDPVEDEELLLRIEFARQILERKWA